MIDSLSSETFLSTGSHPHRPRNGFVARSLIARKSPADMTIAIPDGSTPVESITFTKETQL